MARATRKECREVKVMGASVALYRRARRAGATHEEALSVLREERPFWRYEVFRTAGASHAQALALEDGGVDPVSYRDLRRIGVGDAEVREAHRLGVPLDTYFSARKAGLSHDDAAALVEAGLRHGGVHSWRAAARARRLLADRGRETHETLELLARRADGFKGKAEELVREISPDPASGRERVA